MASKAFKNNMVGAAVLAELDEARAHIRELEREIQTLREYVNKGDRDLDYQKELSDSYRKYWDEARASIAKLQTVIATVDGTADRKRADTLTAETAGLRRRISYLEGWIDSRQGNEPSVNAEIQTARGEPDPDTIYRALKGRS